MTTKKKQVSRSNELLATTALAASIAWLFLGIGWSVDNFSSSTTWWQVVLIFFVPWLAMLASYIWLRIADDPLREAGVKFRLIIVFRYSVLAAILLMFLYQPLSGATDPNMDGYGYIAAYTIAASMAILLGHADLMRAIALSRLRWFFGITLDKESAAYVQRYSVQLNRVLIVSLIALAIGLLLMIFAR